MKQEVGQRQLRRRRQQIREDLDLYYRLRQEKESVEQRIRVLDEQLETLLKDWEEEAEVKLLPESTS